MGLVDALGAEERVPVKYSDFCELVRAQTKLKMIVNMKSAGIPYKAIMEILSDEELIKYKNTGLTPEEIQEKKAMYREKCSEVVKLKMELDELNEQIKEMQKTSELPAQTGEMKATQDEKEDSHDG